MNQDAILDLKALILLFYWIVEFRAYHSQFISRPLWLWSFEKCIKDPVVYGRKSGVYHNPHTVLLHWNWTRAILLNKWALLKLVLGILNMLTLFQLALICSFKRGMYLLPSSTDLEMAAGQNWKCLRYEVKLRYLSYFQFDQLPFLTQLS